MIEHMLSHQALAATAAKQKSLNGRRVKRGRVEPARAYAAWMAIEAEAGSAHHDRRKKGRQFRILGDPWWVSEIQDRKQRFSGGTHS
jgi:hypothetical protein